MAQSPEGFNLPNITFPAARQRINQIFQALLTFNYGATAPSNPTAFMPWLRPSGSGLQLVIRNAANSNWDANVFGTSIPPGSMVYWAVPGSITPQGWLLCDGQAYQQSSYPDLFAAIGTTWNTGGEAAGQFRLPDTRDRALIGPDDGLAVGARPGQNDVSIERRHLPDYVLPVNGSDHTHDYLDHGTPTSEGNGEIGLVAIESQGRQKQKSTGGRSGNQLVYLGGSGDQLSIRSRSLVMSCIIKT